jgi:hypothetical protein
MTKRPCMPSQGLDGRKGREGRGRKGKEEKRTPIFVHPRKFT